MNSRLGFAPRVVEIHCGSLNAGVNIRTMPSITSFIKHHYRHFNAAALVDAADAYNAHLASGGKMFVTIGGAMRTRFTASAARAPTSKKMSSIWWLMIFMSACRATAI
jgi:hypothetical protein